jgi:hypothetical protein
MTNRELHSKINRLQSEAAAMRLYIAVCRKVLGEAQAAVESREWARRKIDVKINRILCPECFK